MTSAVRGSVLRGCPWLRAAVLMWLGLEFARGQVPSDAAVMRGTRFRHVVIHNEVPRGRTLHVYIEGDGNPSSVPSIVRDPSSHRHLMLSLMKLDPSPSVYVGRPCYGGLYRDAGCNPVYWTVRRFSVEVLESMHRIIADEAAGIEDSNLILIGHSGGATLALLLAQIYGDVGGVVTLGGNLDPDAWTLLHGYAPLTGSLNPTRLAPSAHAFRALHWVGSNDRVTPPELVRTAASKIGGEVRVVPGFTHGCCWQTLWPAPLDALGATPSPETSR